MSDISISVENLTTGQHTFTDNQNDSDGKGTQNNKDNDSLTYADENKSGNEQYISFIVNFFFVNPILSFLGKNYLNQTINLLHRYVDLSFL